METRGQRVGVLGTHGRFRWNLLKTLLRLFSLGLRCTGLYRRGVRNALDIQLTRIDLDYPDLPAPFDGFRILQLSDLHLDALPGTAEAARDLVAGIEADLCVLTGDFRFRVRGPFEQIIPELSTLTAAIRSRHGVYAILGNHDCAAMAEAFESVGIGMLINQTLSLDRKGARLHLTGTDDVHYFFTEAAPAALAEAPEGFKIALVHSPELADVAAANDFQLYLTGHTHGGQICLPGERPILTHLDRHRSLASGLWQLGGMRGYTSKGVGVSGLPVRFNTRGEVVLITLHRGAG